jgi:hypothetical protein
VMCASTLWPSWACRCKRSAEEIGWLVPLSPQTSAERLPQNWSPQYIEHQFVGKLWPTSITDICLKQTKHALMASFLASSCLSGGRGHLSAPPSASDRRRLSVSLLLRHTVRQNLPTLSPASSFSLSRTSANEG